MRSGTGSGHGKRTSMREISYMEQTGTDDQRGVGSEDDSGLSELGPGS